MAAHTTTSGDRSLENGAFPLPRRRIHNCRELVTSGLKDIAWRGKNISGASRANFSGSSPRRRKLAKHSRWQPTSTKQKTRRKF